MNEIPPAALYVVFVAAAAGELYFFAMQRSALEIFRAAGLDAPTSKYLLPGWYSLAWIAKLAKWIAAIAIAVTINWAVALVLLAVPFVLAMVIPIAHLQFIPIFRRTLRDKAGSSDDTDLIEACESLLDQAEASCFQAWIGK